MTEIRGNRTTDRTTEPVTSILKARMRASRKIINFQPEKKPTDQQCPLRVRGLFIRQHILVIFLFQALKPSLLHAVTFWPSTAGHWQMRICQWKEIEHVGPGYFHWCIQLLRHLRHGMGDGVGGDLLRTFYVRVQTVPLFSFSPISALKNHRPLLSEDRTCNFHSKGKNESVQESCNLSVREKPHRPAMPNTNSIPIRGPFIRQHRSLPVSVPYALHAVVTFWLSMLIMYTNDMYSSLLHVTYFRESPTLQHSDLYKVAGLSTLTFNFGFPVYWNFPIASSVSFLRPCFFFHPLRVIYVCLTILGTTAPPSPPKYFICFTLFTIAFKSLLSRLTFFSFLSAPFSLL